MPLPQILPEEDLQATYQGMVSQARGLLEHIGVLPYIDSLSQIDPAYTAALGAVTGPPPMSSLGAPTRLGHVIQRYKAASESPLWETMNREQQLQYLRGQAPQRSPELTQALSQSQAIKASNVGQKFKSVGHGHNGIRLGYLKELLEGTR